MRKKVVKVALLSLVACGTPTAFVSCSDDDWKSPVETVETSVEGINNTIKQLDAQITALDGKIAENKAAAEAAAKAAADAMQKAQDAATSAEDAKKYAEEAAKKYAEEAAANALAQAAEQLKAEIEAVKALIEENKTAIAANKALIDGNTAEILRLAGLISGNSDLIAGNTASIEEAVKIIKENAANIQGNSDAIKEILADLTSYKDENGKELTDIRAIIESLKNTQDENAAETANRLAEILEMIAAANGSIDGINGEISNINDICAGLSNSVAGINAAIEVIEGKCESLGLKIDDLENALRDEMGTLEQTLAAQIANEAAAREAGDAALQKMIEDLSKQIEGLNLASNLEQFASFASETETQLAALKAFQAKMEGDFANLSSKVNGIEEIVNKNKSDIASLSTKLTETANQAATNAQEIAAQALIISAHTQAISDLKQDIVDIRASIQELVDGDIKDLLDFKDAISNDIADINGTIDDIQNKINALEPLLNTMTLDQLRGLVFVPNAYVGGVESALSYYIAYRSLSVTDPTTPNDVFEYNNFKVSNHSKWYRRVNAVYNSGFSPLTEVSYHMNPESAVVKYDDLDFILNEAEVVTRSQEKFKPLQNYNNGAGFKINDNGDLTVAIPLDLENHRKAYSDMTGEEYTDNRKMPVFALRAEVQGKVTSDENGNETYVTNYVTSDYAMLVRKNVNLKEIKWNDKKYSAKFGNDKTPVYPSASISNTLDMTTTVTAHYDGSDAVILSDFLDIAYTENQNSYSWTGIEEWEKYGLKMNFELIDYTINGSSVSESSWATINAETGQLTPTNKVEAIGHMPLVYVTVTREDNNVVVLDGFIKVLIDMPSKKYETAAIVYENIPFNCEPVSISLRDNKKVDLYALVKTATGLTKDAFLANYQPVATGTVMTQYKKSGNFSEATGIYEIGEVTYTSGSNYEFNWKIDYEDKIDNAKAKQVLYENDNHVGYTYICFKAKNDPIVYPPIYIPLQLAVDEKIFFTEIATKDQSKWFRNQTTALLNVLQPTNNMQVQTIKTDLDNLWANDVPVFTSSTPNVTQPKYKYYFTAENNGVEIPVPTVNVNSSTDNNAISYKNIASYLYVTNARANCLLGHGAFTNDQMGDHALLANTGVYNNNALYVVKKDDYGNFILPGIMIATINQDTGVIEYSNDEDAQVYLNMFSSMNTEDRLDAKLGAKIGVVPYEDEDCMVAYKLNNPSFDVAFLRPINVKFGEYNFVDGAINGSLQQIYRMLEFSDWLGNDFAGKEWLYAFYGISKIAPKTDGNGNIAGMYTNQVDGKTFKPASQSLVEAFIYTPGIPLNFTPQDANSSNNANIISDLRSGLGTIKYNNQGQNTKSFKVKIPFVVEYALGTFEVYVTCNIGQTLGN